MTTFSNELAWTAVAELAILDRATSAGGPRAYARSTYLSLQSAVLAAFDGGFSPWHYARAIRLIHGWVRLWALPVTR